MFYQEETDNALRFGDVLKGFILTSPIIKNPDSLENYEISVIQPDFCVILSPCCSIGHKVITLSPLIPVRGSFFNNPYFSEDLTRINRKMEPQQTVPPPAWEQFSDDMKQEKLKEGLAHAFLDLFIYENHVLLPEYIVHRKEGNVITQYHMIDFKNSYKIDCDRINSPEDAPLNKKVLQLSIESRSELRDKIAKYYSRIPIEDLII